MPKPVHLVGTVPMDSSAEVFTQVGGKFRDVLRRLPDGETGPRHYWITSQARVLHYDPAFEPAGHDWTPESGTVPETGAPKYRLKPGVDPKTLKLPSFGYGEYARQSYRDFLAAKADGKIAKETRFQVCLPTPIAFYVGIVAPESREAVAPAMEARLAQEVADVLDAVPHDQLAIQWDACLEIYIWEGFSQIFFQDPKQGCLDRLVALGNLVPEPVELGYHFCYGDFRHKHSFEPKDMQVMVDIANAIDKGLRRPLTWLHMPVPRDRDDEAYYAPLRNLKLSSPTEIYLGLVHHTDGVGGTLKRMKAATPFLPAGFGISTECGWGRRDPATIPALMDIHVSCANA